MEILQNRFPTTGGGAGVRLWDRAEIQGHVGERLRCQVQRNNSKLKQHLTTAFHIMA